MLILVGVSEFIFGRNLTGTPGAEKLTSISPDDTRPWTAIVSRNACEREGWFLQLGVLRSKF